MLFLSAFISLILCESFSLCYSLSISSVCLQFSVLQIIEQILFLLCILYLFLSFLLFLCNLFFIIFLQL